MRRYCLFLALMLAVMSVMGQSRLVPTAKIEDAGGNDGYMMIVKDYLLHGQLDGYGNYPSFIYMARPSFTGEYALTGNRDSHVLTCTWAKENLYYANIHNLDKSRMVKYDPAKVYIYQMQVPDSVMRMMETLVESAVETSSYLFRRLGFDGVSYHLEAHGDAAGCWSPNDRCEDLVTLMDQCCAAVVHNRPDSLIALMPQLRELTISFRQDYPDDLFELVSHNVTTYNKDSEKWYYQYLSSRKVQIEWEGEDEDSLQRVCDEFEARYGEELKTFSKWLTCHEFFEGRVCLHEEDFQDGSLSALYQQFLTNREEFMKQHERRQR